MVTTKPPECQQEPPDWTTIQRYVTKTEQKNRKVNVEFCMGKFQRAVFFRWQFKIFGN